MLDLVITVYPPVTVFFLVIIILCSLYYKYRKPDKENMSWVRGDSDLFNSCYSYHEPCLEEALLQEYMDEP